MDRATWKILILLQAVGLSLSREFIPDHEGLFTECQDGPPGYKSIEHLADLSNFVSKREKDGLHISGNLTTVWDIDLNDRIEVNVAIFKQERGKWKATALAGNVKDFCKDMYDKNSLYYPYSTKYVANKPEVKDKCVNNKGAVIILEPYVLKIELGVAVPLSPGPHRIILKWTAVSQSGQPKPNNICIEIPGKIV